jgi:hypothetical protein
VCAILNILEKIIVEKWLSVLNDAINAKFNTSKMQEK